MIREKKEHLKYAFDYGSIIGFIVFLYSLIGFYTGLENNISLFTNIEFILTYGIIIYMFSHYRRQHADEVLKFSRFLAIGSVALLVISLFKTIFIALRVYNLDPFYFNQVYSSIMESMRDMNPQYYSLFEGNKELIPVIKVSFIVTSFISYFIMNFLYVLLLSFCMVINNRVNKKFDNNGENSNS